MQTDADVLTEASDSPVSPLEARSPVPALLAQPLVPPQIQQLSPAALAYIGDAVYELFVRRCYLFPTKRIQTYHQQVVAQVRAETQAQHVTTLLPYLTPDEADWIRRGRNAASGRPKRIEQDIYQQATGLETLIGYLYLANPDRLLELFNLLDLTSSATP